MMGKYINRLHQFVFNAFKTIQKNKNFVLKYYLNKEFRGFKHPL